MLCALLTAHGGAKALVLAAQCHLQAQRNLHQLIGLLEDIPFWLHIRHWKTLQDQNHWPPEGKIVSGKRRFPICVSSSALYCSDSPSDAPNQNFLWSALPHMANPRVRPFILTAAYPDIQQHLRLEPFVLLAAVDQLCGVTAPDASSGNGNSDSAAPSSNAGGPVVAARRRGRRAAAGPSTPAAAARSGSRANPTPTLSEAALSSEAASRNSRRCSEESPDELVEATAAAGPAAAAEEEAAEAPSAAAEARAAQTACASAERAPAAIADSDTESCEIFRGKCLQLRHPSEKRVLANAEFYGEAFTGTLRHLIALRFPHMWECRPISGLQLCTL